MSIDKAFYRGPIWFEHGILSSMKKPTLFILTGPPGAGKNTIASQFLQKLTKYAVIDVDSVRQMVVQPHKAPWEGVAGKAQQELGTHNASMLAVSFLRAGYSVLVLDVITDRTAKIYKQQLRGLDPKIILLLPKFKEVQKRNRNRPPRLKDKEIKMLYRWQQELTVFDKKIDNTNVSATQVVKQLLSLQ